MKQHPITFTAESVRAILDGRKTQTRRVAKFRMLGDVNPGFSGLSADHYCTGAPKLGWTLCSRGHGGVWQQHTRPLATYAVGDELWVREAWRMTKSHDRAVASRMAARPYPLVWYAASADWYQHGADGWREHESPHELFHGRYRHARYMPRWASRILLRVTEVRVERVQDITEEDARAEGVTGHDSEPADLGGTIYAWPGRSSAPSARAHFAHLWDSINVKRAPWESNPWVWVVSFERVV